MSLAKHAKGTLVQVETAEGSGLFETIPEVGDITGPDADSSEHNVTSHDTVGFDSETLVGLIQPRSVSFPLNWVNGNGKHKQIRNDKDGLIQRNYRLVEPTGEYTSFRAMVKTFSKTSPIDGPRRAQVMLRFLGAPTYSDA